MNCARCLNPRGMGGRPPKNPRPAKFVHLVKIGEMFNCERWQCPHCHAIFIFPKLELQPDFTQLPLTALA